MPPKGPAKLRPAGNPVTGKTAGPKTKEPPATPSSVDAESDAVVSETPIKPKPTPKSRVKKDRPVEKPFNRLQDNVGGSAPIDVMYEADTVTSKVLTDVGGYGHDIRLRALQPFTLITTTFGPDGPYPGQQVIIIKPSRSFPFMGLAKAVRLRIYDYYLSPAGKFRGKIEITGNQSSVRAKDYNAGLGKNRLSLLRVCKEIAEEVRPVLYSFAFKFEKSDPVTLWLAGLSDRCRALLCTIEIIQHVKSSGFLCMSMLATCPNIQRVHFGGGVGVNTEPKKAAATFHKDAHRFLETMGSTRGDRYIALDLLSFGKKCFTIKDDEGGVRAWDEDECEEFITALREKM